MSFEYNGNTIPLAVHEVADRWAEDYTRDTYNILPLENWAESIVRKQWDLVYWNSIYRVDDVQLEALPSIASAFHLLLKDLHITWYLCKSSKDIYHTTKQIQEEAQSFILNENCKPIVTLAILKCAA